MPNPDPTTTPHPDALKLPARIDRCLLPELTPDGRAIYSTDALEYMCGKRWSLRCPAEAESGKR